MIELDYSLTIKFTVASEAEVEGRVREIAKRFFASKPYKIGWIDVANHEDTPFEFVVEANVYTPREDVN